ncbi:MAG TPA: DUF928 domain-containing protein [Chroococcales cyanobacterium]
MTYSKLLQTRKLFLIALALVGSYWLPLSNSNLRAQVQSTSLKQSKLHLNGQLPQPQGKQADAGRPEPTSGQPQGGGTRGGCPRVEKPITALVPTSSDRSTSGASQSLRATSKTTSTPAIGLTTAKHPTFWLYVPYSFSSPRRIEFALKDEKGKEIYHTSFLESKISPGIVGFELPSAAPSLEENKVYRWQFSMNCKPEKPDVVEDFAIEGATVEGWIHRVRPNSSLTEQLNRVTPEERVALYSKAGIWYEAVTVLAQLRRQNPNDAKLREEWVQLLKAVDLDAIADEPIVSVLTPKT